MGDLPYIKRTMSTSKKEMLVSKEAVLQKLNEEDTSSLNKYQDFFVGDRRAGALARFELITSLSGPMPGSRWESFSENGSIRASSGALDQVCSGDETYLCGIPRG